METQSIHVASIGTKELFLKAQEARTRAYTPYSKYKVGAAIRLSTGEVFTGCNVENSTFGATVCAERVAVQKAVSELGKIQIVEVVVVTDSDPPATPCGICRQVISEFSMDSAIIHCCNAKEEFFTTTQGELLPHAFTPAHLLKG